MPAPLRVRFGTDGWRGVIARDFTFQSVRLVARAVATTFRAIHPAPPPLILTVGHDTRFLSRQFAQVVAEVLDAEGVKVFLAKSYLPSPVLAWSVPFLGARGGLMVTASHNPPSYNGLKVRAEDGGPATAAVTKQIEAEVMRLAGFPGAGGEGLSRFAERMAAGAIETFDPLTRYRERLMAMVNMPRIAGSRLRVVIDPMYGASQGLLVGWLRGIGLRAEEIHGEVNPWFGGMPPEPLAEHLRELTARINVLDDSRRIGLAFDGDGDRLAAIDEAGSYVTPHQIFALLLRHLATRRGLSGTVVKTFSTTTMIDRLAAIYGMRLIVTPIGFKHIAEVIRREPVLIGGEESGGIGVAGHVPERDAILAALLLLECLATEEKPLGAMLRQLEAEVGPHCYRRLDLRLSGQEKGREIGNRLLADAPTTVEGWRIKEVQALDGVKLIGEDGSWLLVRPSGTEPVLRLYAEASTFEQASHMIAWARTCAEKLDGVESECRRD